VVAGGLALAAVAAAAMAAVGLARARREDWTELDLEAEVVLVEEADWEHRAEEDAAAATAMAATVCEQKSVNTNCQLGITRARKET